MGVSFFAGGDPKPQGSKKAFVVKGRAVLTESAGAPLKDWRRTLTLLAQDAMAGRPPIDGPVAVRLTFALNRPKSHPKTRRTWPTQRPDIDKLTRAVLDALSSVVIADDSQVVELHVRKVWALLDTPTGPGCQVDVTETCPISATMDGAA